MLARLRKDHRLSGGGREEMLLADIERRTEELMKKYWTTGSDPSSSTSSSSSGEGDLSWMLNNHPAWAQVIASGILEANGSLMDEAKQSQWGQTRTVTATLEMSGIAEVTYEGRKGVKTEQVTLGLEMIRYEGDTRPFIALNLGGGSAIRHFLLRTEPKRPDFTVNDDSNSRRYVSRRSSEEAKAEELARVEKQLEKQADDTLAQLLAGEAVTLGFGGMETSNDTQRKPNSKRKGNPSAYRSR